VKLLLDTHVFIWWDGDQSKLSAAALAACQSPANSLHLSLASVWELQIKMQLGKLALHLPLADVLRDQQQQNGLVLEPVTLEDILGFRRFPHFIATRSIALSSPRRIGEAFISSLTIPNSPAIRCR
jgi:PIN domain nuclease of toxin-antitoxin system